MLHCFLVPFLFFEENVLKRLKKIKLEAFKHMYNTKENTKHLYSEKNLNTDKVVK